MEREEGEGKQKEKLPKSWLALPLEDIAEINPRSFCPLPTAKDMPVHFVPMAAIAEEFSGIDVSSQRLLRDVQRGYTAFLEADVLLAKITPCMENGKLAVVPKLANYLGYGSTEFHIIRATSAVQPQWLAFYFSQEEFRRWARKDMTGSAGQLRVSTQWLSRIKPPLAPFAEQSRIIEKLEELLSDLNAGVAELKAAQKKLTQYRQSLLKAAVEGTLTAEWRAERAKRGEPLEIGAQLLEHILAERRRRWEEKQLAKFKEQGKTPPKDWRDKYPEPVKPNTADLPELPEGWVWAGVDQIGEVFLGKMLDKEKHKSGKRLPYLRNVNIRWRYIETHDLLDMYFEDDELDRYGLLAGDVLVCEGGEPGRAAICKKNHEILKYQKALHRVRLFGHYIPDLLVAYLEYAAKTGKLEEYFTGSTIKHFTRESFVSLPIPLPPIEEQYKIIALVNTAVEKVDSQNEAISFSLKQSSAQRQNILKAAFSGQLVPQDPNDEPASVLLERIRVERAARESGVGRRGRKAREDAA